MFKYIVAAALVAHVCCSPESDTDGRIIGGNPASIKEFPYLVSIMRNGNYACAGSIISPAWIVSAAHCLTGRPNEYTIRAGSAKRSAGGQVLRGSKIHLHRSFNPQTMDYDVGVMELESRITISTASAINLPNYGTGLGMGSYANIAGWGSSAEGQAPVEDLQSARVQVVSLAQCRGVYGQSAVTLRMLCTGAFGGGGNDACEGDDGGPLVTGNVLRGIISWGFGCARPDYPRVYANAEQLEAWIKYAISTPNPV